MSVFAGAWIRDGFLLDALEAVGRESVSGSRSRATHMRLFQSGKGERCMVPEKSEEPSQDSREGRN